MIYLSISSDDNWCCVGWWMVTDNLEWITDLTRDGERTHLQPHNSPPSLPPHLAVSTPSHHPPITNYQNRYNQAVTMYEN